MKSEIEKLAEKLKKPPTEEYLSLLPLFTGRKNKHITFDMLHRSYYPEVSVSGILFNNRARAVLESAGIKTIGQLLLTSYTDLLLYRNCGLQTIEVFQAEIRGYILDKEFDYSPYWNDIETMFRNVLNIKERNMLILLYRFGINQSSAMTLQSCGDKFGITREAVRQTLNQIYDILLHPETEYKLRPFWLTIDKVLKKKEIMFTDELARKIKDKLEWNTKPEVHAMERILSLKPDKYTVAINHVIGFSSSECFHCDKLEGFLPKVMGTNVELSNVEVFESFVQEFERCCSHASSLGKQVVNSLVDMQLRKELQRHPQFRRKPMFIINEDLYYAD